MKKVLIVSGVLAAMISSMPAHAENLRAALQNFGLIGHWASDCSAPIADDNTYAEYAMISENEAELRYDFGPKYRKRTYAIRYATRIPGDQIRMVVTDRADSQNSQMIIRRVNGRIQTWSNEQSDGTVYIANGIKVLNGQEADWEVRCY